jgi:hypothetical protein
MGFVIDYHLEAGRYRLQFVSAYIATALIELTTASGNSGGFVDLSSRNRTAR